MASPNVSFNLIPGSTRKPGQYFEFNTSLAVRTLPGNLQKVLIVGQMLASGTAEPLAAVDVFSSDQAALYFGAGSLAHLMSLAAIQSNAYLSLQMIGVPDAETGGVAATATLTLAGTATSTGVVSVWIGDTRLDVTATASDTAAVTAAAIASLVAQKTALPVTATTLDGVLTLTAKHKGLVGNDIKIKAQSTATGMTTAVVAMSKGAGDPDIAPALAAVFAAGHDIVVSPFSTQAALTALRTHVTAVSGPMEQRSAIGVGGWGKSLSTGSTLAGQINDGAISLGWHNGSVKLAGEIAAAYAAVIASEEDPARPLNTLPLAALDVTALADRPGRKEQENALYNGLTPFEIGPGDKVQIVRAITTYIINPQGIDDVSLLDLTTIRTLYYVRKSCRERIALRFPRDKLSSRTPAKVRSELLDVLYKLEELEIVEEVDANKAALIVERDLQDVNQLNAAIPVDVVNGLHVFAARIDLLL